MKTVTNTLKHIIVELLIYCIISSNVNMYRLVFQ